MYTLFLLSLSLRLLFLSLSVSSLCVSFVWLYSWIVPLLDISVDQSWEPSQLYERLSHSTVSTTTSELMEATHQHQHHCHATQRVSWGWTHANGLKPTQFRVFRLHSVNIHLFIYTLHSSRAPFSEWARASVLCLTETSRCWRSCISRTISNADNSRIFYSLAKYPDVFNSNRLLLQSFRGCCCYSYCSRCMLFTCKMHFISSARAYYSSRKLGLLSHIYQRYSFHGEYFWNGTEKQCKYFNVSVYVVSY